MSEGVDGYLLYDNMNISPWEYTNKGPVITPLGTFIYYFDGKNLDEPNIIRGWNYNNFKKFVWSNLKKKNILMISTEI